jgi:hypothetical protein
MAHILIHFLTTAEDIEDAISRVETFLEGERGFYASYEVLRKESGALTDMMETICKLRNGPDSITLAERFLADAEARKNEGCFGQAGYYYRRAGLLYEGALTHDIPVYNIESFDYVIPCETSGWFCVVVNLYILEMNMKNLKDLIIIEIAKPVSTLLPEISEKFRKYFYGFGFVDFFDPLLSMVTQKPKIDRIRFEKHLHWCHPDWQEDNISPPDFIMKKYGAEAVSLYEELV